MKWTILAYLIYASSIFGFEVKVDELNLNYQSPSGNVSFDLFKYDFLKIGQSNLDFKYENNTIFINYGGEIIEIENEDFKIIEKINLESLNTEIKSEKDILFSTRTFLVNSEKTNFFINSVSASCPNKNQINDLEDLLKVCTTTSRIRLNHFKMDSTNPLILDIIKNIFSEVNFTSDLIIKSLALDTENNNFNGKAKIQSSFSATAKISGKIHYLEESKEIRIRLDKAKVGFVSVRGKIFNELNKKKSEKLRVEKPYIFIKL